MAQLILLGTGSAWSGPTRENTFLLIRGERTNVMIDCAGSPAQRLARVNLSPAQVDHLILTHNHPDHIYGLPILMLNAWMAGRRAPFHLYGLPETLRSARALLRSLEVPQLPNFFEIRYHSVRPKSIAPLPSIDEFDLWGARTVHFVPTLALRVTNRSTGVSIAYSADTAPHPYIVELARGTRYLFHEATTCTEPSAGHSSALEAGDQARQAGAQGLVLVHVPPNVKPDKWRAAARRKFRREVIVANDFDSFEF